MVSTQPAFRQERPESGIRHTNPFRSGLAVPVATCLLVAGLAQLPLLRNPWYYFADDAATQVLPMWYRLGEMVRAGEWPPTLVLDAWMGGNLSVESLFGIWNPVNAVVWVFVSLLPNLAVAGTLIRTFAFVALAFGCYLVSREYGAARWASSAVSVALPLCGPLFYLDATKWPAAMLAFVWIPYLWWATRRMAHDRMNAFWVFVLGALGVTSGNPYATLGVCIVLGAVFAETTVRAGLRSARRVVLIGVTIAAIVPLVYLPLLLSKHVTWRSGAALSNTGTLAPDLNDLVNLSFPSYVPEVVGGVGGATVFFCWFALPLAAWLDWRVLRTRARELTGALVMAVVFLMLAIGPAEIWMFRWPLRVLHYGYLAAAVLLAVMLSRGLRTDHAQHRLVVTAGLLLFSSYVAWSTGPEKPHAVRHLLTLLVLSVLTAVVLLLVRSGRSPILGLHIGTCVAFLLQVGLFMEAASPTEYYFPASVPQARANFEHRYQGATLQVADTGLLPPPDQPREAWRDLAFGNLQLPAGVHSVNSYASMGLTPFSDELCLTYHGSTCAEAYHALWRDPGRTGVDLADLLRLDTVVVQQQLVGQFRVPEGWRINEHNDRVTVLRRAEPRHWPAGRLSWAAPGTRVVANTAPDDRHETVRFDRDGGSGRMIFARLAWPGYRAEVDGTPVPAYAGPAGLLEVALPPGMDRGELRLVWQPPRLRSALVIAALGVLGALAIGGAQFRAARRREGATR